MTDDSDAWALEFLEVTPPELLAADGFDTPVELLRGMVLDMTIERFHGAPRECPPLAATELLGEVAIGGPGPVPHYGVLRRHPDPAIQATVVKYAFSLAVHMEGVRRPRFWLLSEHNLTSDGGSHFLGAFDGGAHHNWGAEDRWGRLEVFRDEARTKALERLERGAFDAPYVTGPPPG